MWHITKITYIFATASTWTKFVSWNRKLELYAVKIYGRYMHMCQSNKMRKV